MKKLNVFLILILFGFGVVVQTAHSQAITKAPHLGMGKTAAASKTSGPSHNARLAIAPYAQTVLNNSYTFIGVTHPSLATAHTSIGLVIEAMDMTFTPRGASLDEELRAVVFTINAGETHRVFIVNEGHATIKASNTAFTTANNTHLITTTDDAQFGNIRVTSIGAHPNESTHDGKRDGPYSTLVCSTSTSTNDCIQRFDNLNQLSMWGVVYQEANGAGFSLEFIGDMHDSSASGVQSYTGGNVGVANHTTRMHNHSAHGIDGGTLSTGAGRGIN